MKQFIEIDVPVGKIAKYNPVTNKIEFISDYSTLPKSWEEYKAKGILTTPVELSAQIYSLKCLLRLRDYWYSELNYQPNWDDNSTKYTIVNRTNKVSFCSSNNNYVCILAFHTAEVRDLFYESFKGIIEDCLSLL